MLSLPLLLLLLLPADRDPVCRLHDAAVQGKANICRHSSALYLYWSLNFGSSDPAASVLSHLSCLISHFAVCSNVRLVTVL